ncbi:MAG: hypothetical protein JWN76_999 [Chitinophagaceae bacterium]|nr:hypothetical protein [Chitinophagaceae bacterium]
MKNTFHFSMRALLALLLLVAVNSLSSCSKKNDQPMVTFSIKGNADASQVVPANNSTGSAVFTGTYDQQSKALTYTSTWVNLADVPSGAGFYTGGSGQEGSPVNSWALGAGLAVSGSFSGSVILSADQEAQLLAGNLYYTIATAANASGEVRGQLTATKN